MRQLNGKKLFLATLLIAFLVFFVMPQQAQAQFFSLGDILGGVVAKFAYVISYIIAIILGAFMSATAYLASIALKLNYFVISKSNSLVGIGWSIVRDVANLGFVIVIIIMAFATILRFEKYGYQKILPKLIAAAILINFSLAIAGVFVDFANILTHFFFDRISRDPVEIASTIAGAFNPQRLFTNAPDPNLMKSEAKLIDSLFLLVAQPVFTSVFLLAAIFTMLIFAFLLLLRFLHLTFLLIIAPIVGLFWVIPELTDKFKDWWKDFFKWLFFAPAASFFMYLALRALKESPGFWGQTEGNQLISGLSGLENIIIQGANMVIIVGIMLGGLIISQKMGIGAAEAAVIWAKKQKGAAQKWALGKTKQLGQRALTGGVDTEGKTALERFGARYGKIPLIGRAVTGISGLSSGAKAKLGKGADEQYTRAKERTTEDNVNILNQSTSLMSPEELAGRGIRVAEKGKWKKDPEDPNSVGLDAATQQKVIAALKQTGKANDILAYRPDLAVNFKKPKQTNTQAVEEAMAKYVPDAVKVDKEVFKRNDVVVNLKAAHVAQLGNSGTREQKENAIGKLQTILGGNLPKIDELLRKLQTARGAPAQALLKRLNAAKDGLATDEEKKAFDTYSLLKKNINWQDVLPP